MFRSVWWLTFCLLKIKEYVLRFSPFLLSFLFAKTSILYIRKKVTKYVNLQNDWNKVREEAFFYADTDCITRLCSDGQIKMLQHLQNMAARLICNSTRFCRITPLLFKLHWLPKFNWWLTRQYMGYHLITYKV